MLMLSSPPPAQAYLTQASQIYFSPVLFAWTFLRFSSVWQPAIGLICVFSYMYVCKFVRARAQLQASRLNSPSHGQSEGGLQGEEAIGRQEEAVARQTPRPLLSPFHLPPPASNNKPFNSAIFCGQPPPDPWGAHPFTLSNSMFREKLMIGKWLFFKFSSFLYFFSRIAP